MVLSMKIALCLSGQPRGLPVSLECLQKGLDISSMDIFFHTWFHPETIGAPYTSAQKSQQNKVGVVHPKTQELLLETLKPVDCIIEGQKEFPFARDFRHVPDANQEQIASIFYSMYMANLLKRKHEKLHKFKYDLVIRARYDLFYEDRIDVTKYVEQAQTMIVTAEKFQGIRNDSSFVHGAYTLTDIFALSTSKNMDVFCDTYPHLSYINSQISVPYGENYLGFRTRVMGGIEAYCASDMNYEILHRVMDINNL